MMQAEYGQEYRKNTLVPALGIYDRMDMEAWMDRNHKIMYQHYEKAVSSRPVLHAESTQSCECKHNVHVQELLRRVLNTSSNLDWDIVVAPFLSDYMGRMMDMDKNTGRILLFKHW